MFIFEQILYVNGRCKITCCVPVILQNINNEDATFMFSQLSD